MKKIIVLNVMLFSLISFAQTNNVKKTDSFIGSWSLVSITNIYQNGTKVQPYGEQPDGLLIFDEHGNYAIQILKKNRPLIASGNKNTSTPEENAEIVKGFNAHYGYYFIDTGTKTISFNVLHASFPNWENKVQKRTYSYNNDVLKYIVTNTTQGGKSVVAEVVWKRRVFN
ncbi:lipocalin-like domain-containing protein [Pontimicrobium aquaticum]|uniref:Lipocalin-like domain-containing protein n=1 Tax=Pontimicrobium aquaticum TaxID=2565367 RepID=A0A4U0EVN2_9FLAO|nr:lipocalin-like domain-containing protein [Pontimicrobium aquaticum]TJY35935.1 lipocalin-like domain-containing protein [Pontimicrobium aquaticum]